MKKMYLSLCGIAMTCSLNAQITLTQSNSTPAVGESFSMISQSTNLSVTHDGANQTWDFSGVSGTPQNISAISLSNSLDPASFPSANVVESYATNEVYNISSSTAYAQVGMYAPGQMKLVNSDPRETLMFPLTYQSSYNETFLGDLTNIAASQTLVRGGSVVIESDGYGDLVLPYTTVSNVLRVKTTHTYTDEFQGTTIANYEEVLYQWYDGVNHYYIAAYHELYINGFLNSETAVIMDQSSLVTSVKDIHANASNKLSFYPNPANNEITLESEEVIESVAIIDAKGQVVRQLNQVVPNQTINVSDLNTGLYFIKYQVGNTPHTEKLMIH